jgi:hypothetical protein
MSKNVKFNDIENADGESDRRAEIETKPDAMPVENEMHPDLASAVPAKEPNKNQVTIQKVDELMSFFRNKKDDQIVKEYKVNPIHIHLINDIHNRVYSGKPVHLSDGNHEVVDLLHKRLIKPRD